MKAPPLSSPTGNAVALLVWSDGYFMSTVGVDEETIKRYIEHQGREDSGQAQLELL